MGSFCWYEVILYMSFLIYMCVCVFKFVFGVYPVGPDLQMFTMYEYTRYVRKHC